MILFLNFTIIDIIIALILITCIVLIILNKRRYNSPDVPDVPDVSDTECKSNACKLAYNEDCTASSGSWASTCDGNIDVTNCNVCEKCSTVPAEFQLSCQYFGGPFLDPTDECFLQPLSFEDGSICNNDKTLEWIKKKCKK
jgi:hypothetical protein